MTVNQNRTFSDRVFWHADRRCSWSTKGYGPIVPIRYVQKQKVRAETRVETVTPLLLRARVRLSYEKQAIDRRGYFI